MCVCLYACVSIYATNKNKCRDCDEGREGGREGKRREGACVRERERERERAREGGREGKGDEDICLLLVYAALSY